MRIGPARQSVDTTSTSASLEVLTKLRDDILVGHYGAGQRLRFADLQNRFSSGIGTLREALSQLCAEGLVILDAGRGFRVADVSEDDLRDVTSLLVDFEKRAILASIEQGDEEWEARVITTYHHLSKIEALSKAERVARHAEWVGRHRAFHEALVSACASRWLLNFRAILFDQSERYRLLSKHHRPPESRKVDEHVEIKDAVLNRDAKLAADLLVRHIRETADMVLRHSNLVLRDKHSVPSGRRTMLRAL